MRQLRRSPQSADKGCNVGRHVGAFGRTIVTREAAAAEPRPAPPPVAHGRRRHQIAATGGYDAVNMRAVARHADVSTATLYRYFRSKQHLLVAALGRWLEQFDGHLEVPNELRGDPFRRLWFAVDALYSSLYRAPLLAEAMARAYAVADATAANEAEVIRVHMSEVFADALSDGHTAMSHLEVGELLSDVWAANVLAISHGRLTPAELHGRLSTTVELLAKQNRS
jgi:AcrR family transcriptional regulator